MLIEKAKKWRGKNDLLNAKNKLSFKKSFLRISELKH